MAVDFKKKQKGIIVREGLQRTGISLALTGSGGQSDSDEATVDLEEHGVRDSGDPKGFGNICLATELGLRGSDEPEGNGEQEAGQREANGTQVVNHADISNSIG